MLGGSSTLGGGQGPGLVDISGQSTGPQSASMQSPLNGVMGAAAKYPALYQILQQAQQKISSHPSNPSSSNRWGRPEAGRGDGATELARNALMGLLDTSDQGSQGAGLLGLLGSLTGSPGVQKFNNGLNNWIGQTMNSPAFTLGMGMVNGGTGLNNVGNGIMQSRAAQTQNQLQQAQLQMQRAYGQALQNDPTQGLMQLLLGGQGPQATPQQGQQPQGLLQSQGQQPPGQPSGPMPQQMGAPPGGPPGAPPGAQPAGGLLGGLDPTKLMAVATAMQGSPLPWRQKQGEALMQLAQSEIANNPQLIQQRKLAEQQLQLDYQALSPTARAALDGKQTGAPAQCGRQSGHL